MTSPNDLGFSIANLSYSLWTNSSCNQKKLPKSLTLHWAYASAKLGGEHEYWRRRLHEIKSGSSTLFRAEISFMLLVSLKESHSQHSDVYLQGRSTLPRLQMLIKKHGRANGIQWDCTYWYIVSREINIISFQCYAMLFYVVLCYAMLTFNLCVL